MKGVTVLNPSHKNPPKKKSNKLKPRNLNTNTEEICKKYNVFSILFHHWFFDLWKI